MECRHERTSPTKAEKKLQNGLVFKYKSEACEECGAVRWGPEQDEKFSKWLKNERAKNRDKFTLQNVALPDYAWDFLERQNREFPGGVSAAAAIKSAVLAYCYVVLKNKEMNVSVEAEFNRNAQKLGKSETTVKLRLSIAAYLEFSAHADLLGLTLKQFVEEAASRVFCFIKDVGPSTGNEVREQYEQFVKAAA